MYVLVNYIQTQANRFLCKGTSFHIQYQRKKSNYPEAFRFCSIFSIEQGKYITKPTIIRYKKESIPPMYCIHCIIVSTSNGYNLWFKKV